MMAILPFVSKVIASSTEAMMGAIFDLLMSRVRTDVRK